VIRRAVAAALLALAAAGCGAASLRYCDQPPATTAAQQDHLFRFATAVRETLEAAAAEGGTAIVARSGQRGLGRFGERYSHAGISLKSGGPTPWAVRQLYFACDERVPRLFDQGIAGFVFGTDDPDEGYVSILVLPPAETEAVRRRAADNGYALRLLGADYSANAYAYSRRYQNCNQWVAELLAASWGGLDDAEDLRAAAQGWLKQHGYEPTAFDVGAWWLRLVEPFVSWVHADDHPAEDRAARVYRVSMPASIERLAQAQAPGLERIELCHARDRIVVRRGWVPLAGGCLPAEGDRVIELD
jgi:hypothetical protein